MDGLPGTEATSVIVTVAVSRAAVSPWGMAVSTVTWSGRVAPKENLTPSPSSLDSLSTIAVNESVLRVSPSANVTELLGVRM